MKKGKEIKVSDFKNYKVTFGSVDNKNPKALYINISTWVEPKSDEEINYSRVIKNINKKVRQSLYNLFNSDPNTNFLKDKTIVDLDLRESGLKFGKRSFMSCEITLFSIIEIPVNSEYMKNVLTDISNYLINSVFKKNDSFYFHKKKK